MPEAKKRGRPSKKPGLDLKKVKQLAVKGWTDDEMASFFGIDRATWYRWKAADQAFCDALKDWKSEADARVERSLYEKAVGFSQEAVKIFMPAGAETPVYAPYVERMAPDTTAAIFWLKNRQPSQWRDKQEVELTVSDDIAEMLDARRKRAKASKPG
jgi:hypothetical protein